AFVEYDSPTSFAFTPPYGVERTDALAVLVVDRAGGHCEIAGVEDFHLFGFPRERRLRAVEEPFPVVGYLLSAARDTSVANEDGLLRKECGEGLGVAIGHGFGEGDLCAADL